MDRREKLDFILYQMKMMIKKKDYVRTLIISRKINKKNIEDEGLEDLKILFYSYLTIYYNHEHKFFDNALCYKAIYDTFKKKPKLVDELPKEIEFGFSLDPRNLLENYVMFLSITPYTNEQVQHFLEMKDKYAEDMEANPHLKNVVESMLSTELVIVDVGTYGLQGLELFSQKQTNFELHQKNFRK